MYKCELKKAARKRSEKFKKFKIQKFKKFKYCNKVLKGHRLWVESFQIFGKLPELLIFLSQVLRKMLIITGLYQSFRFLEDLGENSS